MTILSPLASFVLDVKKITGRFTGDEKSSVDPQIHSVIAVSSREGHWVQGNSFFHHRSLDGWRDSDVLSLNYIFYISNRSNAQWWTVYFSQPKMCIQIEANQHCHTTLKWQFIYKNITRFSCLKVRCELSEHIFHWYLSGNSKVDISK